MTLSSEPLRSVTADEIAAYDRDGVVCLQAIFPTDWIEKMAAAITILGRLVTSKLERNSASRVDLPATCCAIMVVAAISAKTSARVSVRLLFSIMKNRCISPDILKYQVVSADRTLWYPHDLIDRVETVI